MITVDNVVRKYVIENEEQNADRFSSVLDSIVSAHSGKQTDTKTAKAISEIVLSRKIKSTDPTVLALSMQAEVDTILKESKKVFGARGYNSTTIKRFNQLEKMMSLFENIPEMFTGITMEPNRFQFKETITEIKSDPPKYNTKGPIIPIDIGAYVAIGKRDKLQGK